MQTITEHQRRQLSEDLPRDVVRTRDQAGQRLSYVDGWYAVTRANDVFGPDGWSYAVREVREVYRGTKPGKGTDENIVIIYEAQVCVTALGITREDVGIGQCDASIRALAQGIEKARKESVTDGLKRALRTFGPSFGLALYDKDQRDVGLSRAAMDLRADLEHAADVDAWVQQHGAEVRALADDERDELRALVMRRREEAAREAAVRAAAAEVQQPKALPPLASLGVEVQTPATTPAVDVRPAEEERGPHHEDAPPPEAPPTFMDLIASIRTCAAPGDVADRWVAAAEDLRVWSSGEREACWTEAVQRVMHLLTASKAIATQKLKAAVEARKPKGPGPRGGHPKPSAPANSDATGDAIGTRETMPAPAQASADAWRETAEGIVAHVAGLGARHIENSGRLHLRAVPEALQLRAVHAYAGRLQRLSYDGSSSTPWDECVARVERWLREGPRVTELRPRTRTAAPARRAVG